MQSRAGVIGGAAFDALALDGSWFAAGVAAIGAALTLIEPDPPGPPAADHTAPEHDPLRASALAGFVVGLVAMASCAPLRPSAEAPSQLVDCTLVSVGDHADELEAAIRDATDMRGAIDWETPRALVRQLGTDVGGCALRLAIERLLASPGVAAGPRAAAETGSAVTPGVSAIGGTGSLRAGWERVRAEDLDGRRYLPETTAANR